MSELSKPSVREGEGGLVAPTANFITFEAAYTDTLRQIAAIEAGMFANGQLGATATEYVGRSLLLSLPEFSYAELEKIYQDYKNLNADIVRAVQEERCRGDKQLYEQAEPAIAIRKRAASMSESPEFLSTGNIVVGRLLDPDLKLGWWTTPSETGHSVYSALMADVYADYQLKNDGTRIPIEKNKGLILALAQFDLTHEGERIIYNSSISNTQLSRSAIAVGSQVESILIQRDIRMRQEEKAAPVISSTLLDEIDALLAEVI